MDSKTVGLNWYQKLVGLIAICGWIFLFASGLLINSEPFRNVITSQSIQPVEGAISFDQGQEPSIYKAWVVVLFCYTPTNIIFLCMLAGLLGALSRIAILHATQEGEEEIPSDKTNPLISGLFRGLFVYFLFISGILIINEAPIITPTQMQYARLSGIMALISFMMSYNPKQFRNFLKSGYDKIDNSISGGK